MTETKNKDKEQLIPKQNVIGTAQDAAMAYLREELDEEEFKDYCGRFGVLPEDIFSVPPGVKSLSPDAGYVRTLSNKIMDLGESYQKGLYEGGGNFKAGNTRLAQTLTTDQGQRIEISRVEDEDYYEDDEELGKIVPKTKEALEVENKQNNLAAGVEDEKDTQADKMKDSPVKPSVTNK